MTREATQDEASNYSAERTFVTETECKVSGYICVSRIDGKDGKECWIHDLEASGMDAVELMARARRQVQEWGFEEVWANVNSPRLMEILVKNGWSLEQVILKGRTK